VPDVAGTWRLVVDLQLPKTLKNRNASTPSWKHEAYAIAYASVASLETA
jgi:hypothetical protein